MNKEALLNELANTTYVMIKPSPLHGIGVFAIRDIPKGTSNIFSKGTVVEKYFKVEPDKIKEEMKETFMNARAERNINESES